MYTLMIKTTAYTLELYADGWYIRRQHPAWIKTPDTPATALGLGPDASIDAAHAAAQRWLQGLKRP